MQLYSFSGVSMYVACRRSEVQSQALLAEGSQIADDVKDVCLQNSEDPLLVGAGSVGLVGLLSLLV